MTTVAVLPEINAAQETTYRAVAGIKHASGKTIGEAIDALTPQLEADEDNAATLIVVQSQRPDRFFTAEQQQRMAELMTLFRASRDAGVPMPEAERVELEQLVEAEVNGAGQRAAALLRGVTK